MSLAKQYTHISSCPGPADITMCVQQVSPHQAKNKDISIFLLAFLHTVELCLLHFEFVCFNFSLITRKHWQENFEQSQASLTTAGRNQMQTACIVQSKTCKLAHYKIQPIFLYLYLVLATQVILSHFFFCIDLSS